MVWRHPTSALYSTLSVMPRVTFLQPPRGQGLGPAITLTTLGEQCMVKAFFALAPSAEASFANSKYEISALAFGLTLDDGAGLRG